MLHIGIDPDTHGGCTLFYGEHLFGFISIEFTKDWDKRLFNWCDELPISFVSIESQVSRPYQNVRGVQKHMIVYGQAQAAVRVSGRHLQFVQPEKWQQLTGVYGLNRRIENAKKRRTANINTYRQIAQRDHPFTRGWDKETQGDIFAATLIGVGGYRLFRGNTK